MVHRQVLGCVAAAALIGLAACAGDVNPVRDVAVSLGAGPPPANTPEFITKTRPTSLDYIPVGTSAPPRPSKARSADEVKAAESEMDSLRKTNEAAANAARQAGASPPPAPAAAPSSTGKPKPKPAGATTP